jgi:Asp-tRNA(Asn)/Glu-tRNA(Gln) amidotransferase A subunit family amidase
LPSVSRRRHFLVIRYDFKASFDSYLAAYPNAPVHSLAEVMAGNKYHPAVRPRLLLSQAIESRDTKEYFEAIAKRNILRQAILKAMADNNLDAVAYPWVRRKASPLGEEQVDAVNCKLAANSGLPAIAVPAGFTPDGLPLAWNCSDASGASRNLSSLLIPMSRPHIIVARQPAHQRSVTKAAALDLLVA